MLKFNIVQILKTKNHICDKQNELPESEIYFDSDLTELERGRPSHFNSI